MQTHRVRCYGNEMASEHLKQYEERRRSIRVAMMMYGGSAVLIVLAFIVQSPHMAYALFAFVLLIALAQYMANAWVSGLECERTISHETLQQGEETTVDLTVTNKRGWPIPWLFVEDLHPRDFPRFGENSRLAILMPGRSLKLRYTIRCPRRGYHRIGPTLLESGDVFGLVKRFRTGVQQDYISVLPTVAYIDTFNIAARRPQGPVRISNRIYEDPTRIAGLREYSPGDPLNRIHWKASAKSGTLFVKQVEATNVLGATLVLDMREDAYTPEGRESRMELAITTTASIAYLLQLSGEQLGMITNAVDAAEIAQWEVETQNTVSRAAAEDAVVGEAENERLSPLTVPTMRTPIQAQQIIENLARVLPGKSLMAEDLILNEYMRLPRDASLLPVVPQVSPQLAEVLAEMQIAGFSVSVFLIRNQSGYEEAAALLAPYNIHVFHIEEPRHLHELNPAKIGR